MNETGRFKYGCPVDKDELGISTWKLLHTMAAVYPKKPTKSQKDDIKTFFGIMSRRYPCDICAKDLANEYDDDNDDVNFNGMVKVNLFSFWYFRLKEEPIAVNSYHDLSQWLCRLHNKVNVKIGKPVFDCSKVDERWRDGWLDGSCD